MPNHWYLDRCSGLLAEYLLVLLLHHEQTVALLERNPVPRVLVIRREPRWVRRLGDLAINDLLQRVLALAIRSEGVHKMHGCSRWAVSVPFASIEVVVRVGGNATKAIEISVAS